MPANGRRDLTWHLRDSLEIVHLIGIIRKVFADIKNAWNRKL
jgi:hypothetical protein